MRYTYYCATHAITAVVDTGSRHVAITGPAGRIGGSPECFLPRDAHLVCSHQPNGGADRPHLVAERAKGHVFSKCKIALVRQD